MSDEKRPLVLLVDEVPPVLKLLELELGFQGLHTDTVLLEDDPLSKAIAIQPDAIVVAAVVPTPGIYDLVQRLKAQLTTKVLFINGTGNDADTALALEAGADDSISRPFLPEAMGLHLRSLLGLDPPEATLLTRGPLRIDTLRRLVWRGEAKLAPGTTEWGLLLALARAEAPLTANDLLLAVWGESYVGEVGFLELWINRLRVTLLDNGSDPKLVIGDISHGYRLSY